MHRAMTSAGGSKLAYNLFVDPGYATVWGDGTAGSAPSVAVPGGLKPARIPVYGALAPRQFVESGSYSDDLYVSLDF
jgi:spore coat protein U-like protein